MKTETRSATDSPFIPPHLVQHSPHRNPSAFHISIVAAASARLIFPIVLSEWVPQADIMEATLTRESVYTHPPPVTYSFNLTFLDVPTSDSKSKRSPTVNTRSPNATSSNFAPSSVSLPFQTSRRHWKNVSESQSSPSSRFLSES